MNTIIIYNERAGILDLHMVRDIAGKPVVLQPKGMKGDHRECPADALNNPHVMKIKTAGWIRVDKNEAHRAPPPPPQPKSVSTAKMPIIPPPPPPETPAPVVTTFTPPAPETSIVSEHDATAARDDLTVKVDDAEMADRAEASTKVDDPIPPTPISPSKWPSSRKKK
jgi:hypothetical protein